MTFTAKAMSTDGEVDLLRESGLLEAAWYVAQYPDVTALGIEPAEHYLRFGARLLRDPGPGFSTQYYIDANPDVAAAGINPLLHYIRHGRNEGRAPLPYKITPEHHADAVDVVIPVFNALDDVKKCLESVRLRKDGFKVRCIVVNDGSAQETTEYLRHYCGANLSTFELIEHSKNYGYTRAVNTGLRASTAPYVVLLNSDTVVTRGWLRGLVRCLHADPTVGIVGPLSNAASWQNVPQLLDDTGTFAVNELPLGMVPDDIARLVASVSRRTYPRLPVVNGFCFMIKRAVIDAVGYMDEENFPQGYGEENDYCVRASDAGFTMAIADDVYVFHAKSKSFGDNRRKELSRQGSAALRRKHTAARFNALVERAKQTTALDNVRGLIQAGLQRPVTERSAFDFMAMRVLFLLPVRGGGGGAHSVVQEVAEMRRLGMHARVGVKQDNLDNFLSLYEDVPNASELFVGFDLVSLHDLAESHDIVVATVFSSMDLVKRITDASPHILPAYYVQDYEPLFFGPGTDNWKFARDSYTLVPHATIFAKTHWIARQLLAEHGVRAHKVDPSVDHEVYRPRTKYNDGRIHISAMIRPQTPRRGAARTMRVLSRLAKAHPDKLAYHFFGCDQDSPHFQQLTRDFEFRNYGTLKRPAVGELLGRSDLFIDLSDYQAFGRTALEAMACGCAAVVPIHGGGDEYAIDGENAVVVDSLNEDECFERLDALIRYPGELRRMQAAGLSTAARYSVHAAAMSELALFARELARHRTLHMRQTKPRVLLLPAYQKDGQTPTESAWVRLLLPYRSSLVCSRFDVNTQSSRELPVARSCEIALIQRDCPNLTVEDLESWLQLWRRAGGKLIFEIDDDLLDATALVQRRYSGDTSALAHRVQWLSTHADLITVSTEALAKKLRQYNRHVAVLPNRLDADLWRLNSTRDHSDGPYRRVQGNAIRIGYIGTLTHDSDMDLVTEAMRRIEDEYGNRVLIEVIGAFQHRTPTFGRRVALPSNNDYPNFVNWLHQRVHWDIGIISMADDDFNRSKSNLKFLEYAALDMAIVVSDVGSYRDIARDGENALVVPNRTDAWYEAVKRLIDDPELRKRLSMSARELVRSSYSIDSIVPTCLGVLTGSHSEPAKANGLAA